MAEIIIAPGFRNEQAILRQVREILRETGLDGRLCKVYIKPPPAKANMDNNYLKPLGSAERHLRNTVSDAVSRKTGVALPLLELEVVDSLENLEGRLRHELMHVDDQMDESFSYHERKVPKTGTALLRRYKYLWNVYIDGRLIKAGKPAYAAFDSREDEMGECWPELSEDTRKELFDYLWNLSDTGTLTQKQILQLSKDVFKFRKDLKARAKARGEGVKKFKTLENLQHFAQ